MRDDNLVNSVLVFPEAKNAFELVGSSFTKEARALFRGWDPWWAYPDFPMLYEPDA